MLIGVVGKPNTGKSTFFKALTLADAEIANYPFTTIEPNMGVGYVKIKCVCREFDKKCNPKEGYCTGEFRFVPAKVVDVAGLVPGAHEGAGRGNQFLDDLRQADCLIHVIDASGSTNESGEPVTPGSYDPAEDIRFLEVELDMWYFGIIKKGWEKFARQMMQERRQVDKALGNQLSGLGVNDRMVESVIKKLGLNADKPTDWTDDELKAMATELRRITKPMIIAANKSDMPTGKDNIEKLKIAFPENMIVACSSESELALKGAVKQDMIEYVPGEKDFVIKDESKLNDKQKAAFEFIKNNVLSKFDSTGVQATLNDAVFKLLNYIAVFPVPGSSLADQKGNILPDCYLIPEGSSALDFAYRIHTTFGESFIRAIDIRTKMTVGKEHILKDRDVVEVVSSK